MNEIHEISHDINDLIGRAVGFGELFGYTRKFLGREKLYQLKMACGRLRREV